MDNYEELKKALEELMDYERHFKALADASLPSGYDLPSKLWNRSGEPLKALDTCSQHGQSAIIVEERTFTLRIEDNGWFSAIYESSDGKEFIATQGKDRTSLIDNIKGSIKELKEFVDKK